MTYHRLNGRGYGHVTVFKFCRLPLCSAWRGFVGDSWSLLFIVCFPLWSRDLAIAKVHVVHFVNMSPSPLTAPASS